MPPESSRPSSPGVLTSSNDSPGISVTNFELNLLDAQPIRSQLCEACTRRPSAANRRKPVSGAICAQARYLPTIAHSRGCITFESMQPTTSPTTLVRILPLKGYIKGRKLHISHSGARFRINHDPHPRVQRYSPMAWYRV